MSEFSWRLRSYYCRSTCMDLQNCRNHQENEISAGNQNSRVHCCCRVDPLWPTVLHAEPARCIKGRTSHAAQQCRLRWTIVHEWYKPAMTFEFDLVDMQLWIASQQVCVTNQATQDTSYQVCYRALHSPALNSGSPSPHSRERERDAMCTS